MPKNLLLTKWVLCLVILFNIEAKVSAQIIMPFTLNVSGSSANSGYFSFDWSVGESTAITTLTNRDLILSQGLLQYHAGNIVEKNVGTIWFPNEVKIFPNPVKNILEINFKHLSSGELYFELYDQIGKLLWKKNVIYNGVSHIEKINMAAMIAGQYTIRIYQLSGPNESRKYYKQGAFKIIKIN